MSLFDLSDPIDNVLEERIEWVSIIISKTLVMLVAYWERGSIRHYVTFFCYDQIADLTLDLAIQYYGGI